MGRLHENMIQQATEHQRGHLLRVTGRLEALGCKVTWIDDEMVVEAPAGVDQDAIRQAMEE
jgi:hypothetical protein